MTHETIEEVDRKPGAGRRNLPGPVVGDARTGRRRGLTGGALAPEGELHRLEPANDHARVSPMAAADGVPVIAPDVVFSDRPAGSVPEVRAKPVGELLAARV